MRPLSCKVVCRRVVLKIEALPCCKLVSWLELNRESPTELELSKIASSRGVFSIVLLKRLKAGKLGSWFISPAHVASNVEQIALYMAEPV